jgi:hypothetical protein
LFDLYRPKSRDGTSVAVEKSENAPRSSRKNRSNCTPDDVLITVKIKSFAALNARINTI